MRVSLLAVSCAGCVNTVRFPPDLWVTTWESGGSGASGTRTPTGGEIAVLRAQASCDDDDTAWTITARTSAWIGAARVQIYRTDGAEEDHRMSVMASDPAGGWDEVLAGPLADGVAPDVQVPDVDTRFDCEADRLDLTWLVRVWDAERDLRACAVWGSDPAAAVGKTRNTDPDVLALGGCTELGS